MKKFNITSEKLGVIAFTTIQILCVLIAAAFALQEIHTHVDSIAAIVWLIIAGFFERVKYKIIQHQYDKECEECKEWQRCNDLTEG